MTVVLRGYCPDCGKPEPFGAACYSDTGRRVVACVCSSRKPPAPRELVPIGLTVTRR